jgi:hypothetical protein
MVLANVNAPVALVNIVQKGGLAGSGRSNANSQGHVSRCWLEKWLKLVVKKDRS